jgi:NAD-dependent SIR2 family protein deacetylase
LGQAGVVTAVITQNVDELHQAAGSPRVVDLHGRLSQVVCLGCRELTPRGRLHERLAALNPGWAEREDLGSADIAPDGDVDLDDTAGFVVAPCERCGGVLKPDVVFFGENVPAERVEHCYALVEAARVLLVAGTSCTVFSGRRFVARAAREGIPVVVLNRGPTRAARVLLVAGTSCTVFSGRRFVARAAREGIPVVVLNRGPTRAADLATVHLDAGCSPVLARWAQRLAASAA